MTLPQLQALILGINEVALRGLHDRLVEFEFGVASTTDSGEALSWLAQPPHVLFVDFEMPKLPGAEFVAQVRASSTGAEVPIIATSSAMVTELPEEVAAWLSTPVCDASLLEALEQALQSSPEAQRAAPERRRGRRDSAAPANVPLTLYGDDGRFGVEIESCQTTGMRVLSREAELPLGKTFKAQVPWGENRVRLTVRVDSVTEAGDGWHCGLAIKKAEPPHWWSRFVAQRSR